MSTGFEWHFGDELPGANDEQEEPRQPLWRRWLPWLLTLLLVIGGGYAWWRQRQTNLAQAEAEVQQVARLELRALAEGDVELYGSLQDPADRSWREAQATYVETAGLPLPLQHLTAPVSTTVESARVVGDRAQVQIAYAATLPSGEEAHFVASRYYRYTNDGRWLHTWAISDDLGHTITFVVDEMRITSFAADAEWLEPLTSRLGGIPYTFCSRVSCQQDLSLTLDLAANLEQGARRNDARLPAPFLVGAPQNEVAEVAWQESLAQFLVDYLLTQEIGARPEDDDDGALVEERFRAWLKAELGVRESVAPDLELVREALGTEQWIPTWRLSEVPLDAPSRPLAAAEIDLWLAFIEEKHGATLLTSLIHNLRDTDYLIGLLTQVEDHAWTTLEGRYLAYVRRRTAQSTDELSAFPTYDLLVRCFESLEAIDLAHTWGWRFDGQEPVLLSSRPADEAVSPVSWSPDGTRLLIEREPDAPPTYAVLPAGSDIPDDQLLPEGARPVGRYGFGDSGWSPDGSLLAYHVYDENASRTVSTLVDVTTGAKTPLDGLLIAWSPGGSQLLYTRSTDLGSATPQSEDTRLLDLHVADRDGGPSRRIGEGYTGVWSPDGRQIAYVGAEPALMLYDPATDDRTPLLDRDALEDALGFTPSPSATYMSPFVLAWAPDGEWIALGATKYSEEGPVAGAVLLAQADEHRVQRRERGGIHDLAWSPDGQWLRALGTGEGFSSTVVGRDGSALLAAANAFTTWSPDGQYLALTTFADTLRIRDMQTGRWRDVTLKGRCWPPIWNPRGLRVAPTAIP